MRLGREIGGLVRFLHVPVLSFTLILPILGVSSVTSLPNWSQVVPLAVAACAFHIYAYVLNDYIDLPVDRTVANRMNEPLVTGRIRPAYALACALAQIPIAAAATAWLGAGSLAWAALAFAFAAMALYDRYSKRAPFPPLLDLVQGLAWASLVLYGAAALAHAPNGATWLITLYIVVYVVLVNGIHAGLRDLANDERHGMRTTAIFLGARPLPEQRMSIPPQFRLYGFVLQALLCVVAVTILASHWGARGVVPPAVGWGLAILLMAAALALSRFGDPARHTHLRVILLGRIHVIVTLSILVAAVLPHLGALLLAIYLGLYVAPLYRVLVPRSLKSYAEPVAPAPSGATYRR